MEKRYQVFVSSTFRDLQDERQEVMQALLELDCIPAGMELFPAANDDQWTLIKKVIDDCDYYMVILGGRYGSMSAEGISFTEMEYRYAIAQGKPVIGFLHRDPAKLPLDRSETDSGAREKLEQFRALVQHKMCRFWETPADLGSQVSRSLVKLVRSNPAVGWIRADQVTEDMSAELLRLRKRIEDLERELNESRRTAPAGTASLAQGDDRFRCRFTFLARSSNPQAGAAYARAIRHRRSLDMSWNEIFGCVAPLMIDEATESQIHRSLAHRVEERARRHFEEEQLWEVADLRVDDADFQTIKVQLRALGLIVKSGRSKSVKDPETYWTLTPYGDQVMTYVKAIRRDEANSVENAG